MSTHEAVIPLADAALARGETREVTLRRVMRGELRGERRGGRWVVFVASAETGHEARSAATHATPSPDDGNRPRRRSGANAA